VTVAFPAAPRFVQHSESDCFLKTPV